MVREVSVMDSTGGDGRRLEITDMGSNKGRILCMKQYHATGKRMFRFKQGHVYLTPKDILELLQILLTWSRKAAGILGKDEEPLNGNMFKRGQIQA